MRMSAEPWLRTPATAFVEFYRNTPPIVHFFWFFYALPIVIGLSLDPFVAAVLALSTQSGAFYAEVFRGGIVSVERGQWEGAQGAGHELPDGACSASSCRRRCAGWSRRSSSGRSS